MAQYIDKDILVAEIEKRIEKHRMVVSTCRKEEYEYFKGMLTAEETLFLFLNTLEVKEVDLNEEFDKYFFNFVNPDTGEKLKRKECWLNIRQARKFAKRFFELGLKAQKGE